MVGTKNLNSRYLHKTCDEMRQFRSSKLQNFIYMNKERLPFVVCLPKAQGVAVNLNVLLIRVMHDPDNLDTYVIYVNLSYVDELK